MPKEKERNNSFRFIRQPRVTELTSIPKSSIPIEIEEGNFPAPVDIGKRSRAWLESEVHAWMNEKLKQRDEKKKKFNHGGKCGT